MKNAKLNYLLFLGFLPLVLGNTHFENIYNANRWNPKEGRNFASLLESFNSRDVSRISSVGNVPIASNPSPLYLNMQPQRYYHGHTIDRDDTDPHLVMLQPFDALREEFIMQSNAKESPTRSSETNPGFISFFKRGGDIPLGSDDFSWQQNVWNSRTRKQERDPDLSQSGFLKREGDISESKNRDKTSNPRQLGKSDVPVQHMAQIKEKERSARGRETDAGLSQRTVLRKNGDLPQSNGDLHDTISGSKHSGNSGPFIPHKEQNNQKASFSTKEKGTRKRTFVRKSGNLPEHKSHNTSSLKDLGNSDVFTQHKTHNYKEAGSTSEKADPSFSKQTFQRKTGDHESKSPLKYVGNNGFSKLHKAENKDKAESALEKDINSNISPQTFLSKIGGRKIGDLPQAKPPEETSYPKQSANDFPKQHRAQHKKESSARNGQNNLDSDQHTFPKSSNDFSKRKSPEWWEPLQNVGTGLKLTETELIESFPQLYYHELYRIDNVLAEGSQISAVNHQDEPGWNKKKGDDRETFSQTITKRSELQKRALETEESIENIYQPNPPAALLSSESSEDRPVRIENKDANHSKMSDSDLLASQDIQRKRSTLPPLEREELLRYFSHRFDRIKSTEGTSSRSPRSFTDHTPLFVTTKGSLSGLNAELLVTKKPSFHRRILRSQDTLNTHKPIAESELHSDYSFTTGDDSNLDASRRPFLRHPLSTGIDALPHTKASSVPLFEIPEAKTRGTWQHIYNDTIKLKSSGGSDAFLTSFRIMGNVHMTPLTKDFFGKTNDHLVTSINRQTSNGKETSVGGEFKAPLFRRKGENLSFNRQQNITLAANKVSNQTKEGGIPPIILRNHTAIEEIRNQNRFPFKSKENEKPQHLAKYRNLNNSTDGFAFKGKEHEKPMSRNLNNSTHGFPFERKEHEKPKSRNLNNSTDGFPFEGKEHEKPKSRNLNNSTLSFTTITNDGESVDQDMNHYVINSTDIGLTGKNFGIRSNISGAEDEPLSEHQVKNTSSNQHGFHAGVQIHRTGNSFRESTSGNVTDKSSLSSVQERTSRSGYNTTKSVQPSDAAVSGGREHTLPKRKVFGKRLEEKNRNTKEKNESMKSTENPTAAPRPKIILPRTRFNNRNSSNKRTTKFDSVSAQTGEAVRPGLDANGKKNYGTLRGEHRKNARPGNTSSDRSVYIKVIDYPSSKQNATSTLTKNLEVSGGFPHQDGDFTSTSRRKTPGTTEDVPEIILNQDDDLKRNQSHPSVNPKFSGSPSTGNLGTKNVTGYRHYSRNQTRLVVPKRGRDNHQSNVTQAVSHSNVNHRSGNVPWTRKRGRHPQSHNNTSGVFPAGDSRGRDSNAYQTNTSNAAHSKFEYNPSHKVISNPELYKENDDDEASSDLPVSRKHTRKPSPGAPKKISTNIKHKYFNETPSNRTRISPVSSRGGSKTTYATTVGSVPVTSNTRPQGGDYTDGDTTTESDDGGNRGGEDLDVFMEKERQSFRDYQDRFKNSFSEFFTHQNKGHHSPVNSAPVQDDRTSYKNKNADDASLSGYTRDKRPQTTSNAKQGMSYVKEGGDEVEEMLVPSGDENYERIPHKVYSIKNQKLKGDYSGKSQRNKQKNFWDHHRSKSVILKKTGERVHSGETEGEEQSLKGEDKTISSLYKPAGNYSTSDTDHEKSISFQGKRTGSAQENLSGNSNLHSQGIFQTDKKYKTSGVSESNPSAVNGGHFSYSYRYQAIDKGNSSTPGEKKPTFMTNYRSTSGNNSLFPNPEISELFSSAVKRNKIQSISNETSVKSLKPLTDSQLTLPVTDNPATTLSEDTGTEFYSKKAYPGGFRSLSHRNEDHYNTPTISSEGRTTTETYTKEIRAEGLGSSVDRNRNYYITPTTSSEDSTRAEIYTKETDTGRTGSSVESSKEYYITPTASSRDSTNTEIYTKEIDSGRIRSSLDRNKNYHITPTASSEDSTNTESHTKEIDTARGGWLSDRNEDYHITPTSNSAGRTSAEIYMKETHKEGFGSSADDLYTTPTTSFGHRTNTESSKELNTVLSAEKTKDYYFRPTTNSEDRTSTKIYWRETHTGRPPSDNKNYYVTPTASSEGRTNTEMYTKEIHTGSFGLSSDKNQYYFTTPTASSEGRANRKEVQAGSFGPSPDGNKNYYTTPTESSEGRTNTEMYAKDIHTEGYGLSSEGYYITPTVRSEDKTNSKEMHTGSLGPSSDRNKNYYVTTTASSEDRINTEMYTKEIDNGSFGSSSGKGKDNYNTTTASSEGATDMKEIHTGSFGSYVTPTASSEDKTNTEIYMKGTDSGSFRSPSHRDKDYYITPTTSPKDKTSTEIYTKEIHTSGFGSPSDRRRNHYITPTKPSTRASKMLHNREKDKGSLQRRFGNRNTVVVNNNTLPQQNKAVSPKTPEREDEVVLGNRLKIKDLYRNTGLTTTSGFKGNKQMGKEDTSKTVRQFPNYEKKSFHKWLRMNKTQQRQKRSVRVVKKVVRRKLITRRMDEEPTIENPRNIKKKVVRKRIDRRVLNRLFDGSQKKIDLLRIKPYNLKNYNHFLKTGKFLEDSTSTSGKPVFVRVNRVTSTTKPPRIPGSELVHWTWKAALQQNESETEIHPKEHSWNEENDLSAVPYSRDLSVTPPSLLHPTSAAMSEQRLKLNVERDFPSSETNKPHIKESLKTRTSINDLDKRSEELEFSLTHSKGHKTDSSNTDVASNAKKNDLEIDSGEDKNEFEKRKGGSLLLPSSGKHTATAESEELPVGEDVETTETRTVGKTVVLPNFPQGTKGIKTGESYRYFEKYVSDEKRPEQKTPEKPTREMTTSNWGYDKVRAVQIAKQAFYPNEVDFEKKPQTSRLEEKKQTWDLKKFPDFKLANQNGYPRYHKIPKTSFSCKKQTHSGYFADPETDCQVFHFCHENGMHNSFLCPNSSVFNQKILVCDWWINVDCTGSVKENVWSIRKKSGLQAVAENELEDWKNDYPKISEADKVPKIAANELIKGPLGKKNEDFYGYSYTTLDPSSGIRKGISESPIKKDPEHQSGPLFGKTNLEHHSGHLFGKTSAEHQSRPLLSKTGPEHQSGPLFGKKSSEHQNGPFFSKTAPEHQSGQFFGKTVPDHQSGSVLSKTAPERQSGQFFGETVPDHQSGPVLSKTGPEYSSRPVFGKTSTEYQSRPLSSKTGSEHPNRPLFGKTNSERQSEPLFGKMSPEHQNGPFFSKTVPERQSGPLFGKTFPEYQSGPLLSKTGPELQSRPLFGKTSPEHQRTPLLSKTGPEHPSEPLFGGKTDSERQSEPLFDKTSPEHQNGPFFSKTVPERPSGPLFGKTAPDHQSGPLLSKTGPEHQSKPLLSKTGSEHLSRPLFGKTDSKHQSEPLFGKTSSEHQNGPFFSKAAPERQSGPLFGKTVPDHQSGQLLSKTGPEPSRPLLGKTDSEHQREPLFGKTSHEHQNRPFFSKTVPQRQSGPLFGKTVPDHQSGTLLRKKGHEYPSGSLFGKTGSEHQNGPFFSKDAPEHQNGPLLSKKGTEHQNEPLLYKDVTSSRNFSSFPLTTEANNGNGGPKTYRENVRLWKLKSDGVSESDVSENNSNDDTKTYRENVRLWKLKSDGVSESDVSENNSNDDTKTYRENVRLWKLKSDGVSESDVSENNSNDDTKTYRENVRLWKLKSEGVSESDVSENKGKKDSPTIGSDAGFGMEKFGNAKTTIADFYSGNQRGIVQGQYNSENSRPSDFFKSEWQKDELNDKMKSGLTHAVPEDLPFTVNEPRPYSDPTIPNTYVTPIPKTISSFENTGEIYKDPVVPYVTPEYVNPRKKVVIFTNTDRTKIEELVDKTFRNFQKEDDSSLIQDNKGKAAGYKDLEYGRANTPGFPDIKPGFTDFDDKFILNDNLKVEKPKVNVNAEWKPRDEVKVPIKDVHFDEDTFEKFNPDLEPPRDFTLSGEKTKSELSYDTKESNPLDKANEKLRQKTRFPEEKFRYSTFEDKAVGFDKNLKNHYPRVKGNLELNLQDEPKISNKNVRFNEHAFVKFHSGLELPHDFTLSGVKFNSGLSYNMKQGKPLAKQRVKLQHKIGGYPEEKLGFTDFKDKSAELNGNLKIQKPKVSADAEWKPRDAVKVPNKNIHFDDTFDEFNPSSEPPLGFTLSGGKANSELPCNAKEGNPLAKARQKSQQKTSYPELKSGYTAFEDEVTKIKENLNIKLPKLNANVDLKPHDELKVSNRNVHSNGQFYDSFIPDIESPRDFESVGHKFKSELSYKIKEDKPLKQGTEYPDVKLGFASFEDKPFGLNKNLKIEIPHMEAKVGFKPHLEPKKSIYSDRYGYEKFNLGLEPPSDFEVHGDKVKTEVFDNIKEDKPLVTAHKKLVQQIDKVFTKGSNTRVLIKNGRQANDEKYRSFDENLEIPKHGTSFRRENGTEPFDYRKGVSVELKKHEVTTFQPEKTTYAGITEQGVNFKSKSFEKSSKEESKKAGYPDRVLDTKAIQTNSADKSLRHSGGNFGERFSEELSQEFSSNRSKSETHERIIFPGTNRADKSGFVSSESPRESWTKIGDTITRNYSDEVRQSGKEIEGGTATSPGWQDNMDNGVTFPSTRVSGESSKSLRENDSTYVTPAIPESKNSQKVRELSTSQKTSTGRKACPSCDQLVESGHRDTEEDRDFEPTFLKTKLPDKVYRLTEYPPFYKRRPNKYLSSLKAYAVPKQHSVFRKRRPNLGHKIEIIRIPVSKDGRTFGRPKPNHRKSLAEHKVRISGDALDHYRIPRVKITSIKDDNLPFSDFDYSDKRRKQKDKIVLKNLELQYTSKANKHDKSSKDAFEVVEGKKTKVFGLEPAREGVTGAISLTQGLKIGDPNSYELLKTPPMIGNIGIIPELTGPYVVNFAKDRFGHNNEEMREHYGLVKPKQMMDKEITLLEFDADKGKRHGPFEIVKTQPIIETVGIVPELTEPHTIDFAKNRFGHYNEEMRENYDLVKKNQMMDNVEILRQYEDGDFAENENEDDVSLGKSGPRGGALRQLWLTKKTGEQPPDAHEESAEGVFGIREQNPTVIEAATPYTIRQEDSEELSTEAPFYTYSYTQPQTELNNIKGKIESSNGPKVVIVQGEHSDEDNRSDEGLRSKSHPFETDSREKKGKERDYSELERAVEFETMKNFNSKTYEKAG